MVSLRRYVKQRDKMLKKCSVEELKKFIKKHSEVYSKEFISQFENVDDEVLEITLHKMIVNVVSLPIELRVKSKDWLTSKGYDLKIN